MTCCMSGLNLWSYLKIDGRFPEDANTWRSSSEKNITRSQRDKPDGSKDNGGQCSGAETVLLRLFQTGNFSPSLWNHAFYVHLKWGWTSREWFWLCISLSLSTLSQMSDGAAFQPFISVLMPLPVTGLQGLRWSMSFQPIAGTMLLLKNDDRHSFAYFLKQKIVASSKVPAKFDESVNEAPPPSHHRQENKGWEGNVLGDPGNQRFCLEDHLLSVAALDRFTVDQAA